MLNVECWIAFFWLEGKLYFAFNYPFKSFLNGIKDGHRTIQSPLETGLRSRLAIRMNILPLADFGIHSNVLFLENCLRWNPMAAKTVQNQKLSCLSVLCCSKCLKQQIGRKSSDLPQRKEAQVTFESLFLLIGCEQKQQRASCTWAKMMLPKGGEV